MTHDYYMKAWDHINIIYTLQLKEKDYFISHTYFMLVDFSCTIHSYKYNIK